GDDPRWLADIDDPEGKPQTRIAVQPIVHDRRVRAVLVAIRRWRRSDFADGDLDMLARFAELAAPPVERVTLSPTPTPPPLPVVESPEDTAVDRAPPAPPATPQNRKQSTWPGGHPRARP